MMRPTIALFIVWAGAGCASNLYPVGPLERFPASFSRRKVFVTNPQRKEEVEILKQSGIFEITDDPSNAAPITLQKLESIPQVAPALSILFAPRRPQYFIFGYRILEEGKTIQQEFVLRAEWRKTIFGRLLKLFLSKKKTLGDILASQFSKAYGAGVTKRQKAGGAELAMRRPISPP
jgi:hypothetical protein